MDGLIVEHVRCFGTMRQIPLAPLTLLVGENSTGKSTFLALTRLAWDIAQGNSRPDFNEEPFSLGAYDQLATFRGGRGGRAASFSIGGFLRIPSPDTPDGPSAEAKWVAEFQRVGAQPIITEWGMQSNGSNLKVRFDKKGDWSAAELTLPSGRKLEMPNEYQGMPLNMVVAVPQFIFGRHDVPAEEVTPFLKLYEPWRHLLMIQGRPYATAPIRTKPERTYNPMTDVPRPEGGHVPMILAKTFFEDKDNWARLKKALEEFGRQSGLMESIAIRALGKRESDAFQIRIRIGGPPRNLVDVGYGVSQVLPILVDALRSDAPRSYLLQQPEVHLHPKAQAALGSFLLSLVREGRKQFIVETHSDFLIERIRVEARDSASGISPSLILILFFEQKRGQVTVRPVHVDGRGNLVDAPKTYRAFFLSEEQRLLGL